MLEKVIDIICRNVDIPREKITGDTNLLTDLGLQSIDFIDMVCDFEETFDVEVPERDLRKLVTVKSIVSYIEDNS
ncbi:MAG: acyl carrier protein [Oscillospiraceae bacterium]|nr:acyl carrier protein [Oscillospiraceae bacterium]